MMDAGFIAAEDSRTVEVEAQLKETYFIFPFQLRDAMDDGKLYLNAKQFASVFPGRRPDFVPQVNPAP